ncbi:carnitine/choline acetyltransferase [Angomonas deanei]|nr:carnitine/choline acetyltransferase [Angomonas deanei]|eukprot:EPY33603.1 carnitine/choline acetyltransferase [Angomonas deanei]
MKRIELSKLTKNVLKLPRLPVPTLDHTFDAYRRSVVALRPAESDEVKAHFTKLDTFLRQSAPSIQKNIVAKDKAAEEAGTYPFTYVESLLEHQFLKSRTPEVNMNSVFILKPDALKHVEKKEGASDHQIQAAAAARSLYAIGLWLQEVKAQGVPLPEEVSTFLTQQKNAVLTIDQILEGQLHESCIDLSPLHHEFGRSLIPAADVDEIKTTPIEELGHVVVLHDGFPYLLNIMDPADKSRTLSLEEIQKGLEYILSVTPETDNTTPVSVLTAASRTLWSKAYAELTKGEENAKNKEMLEKFHTAVLIVCLDSGKWSDHASLAESAALHGSKEELENRWYDKHQMIVSADGQLAFNFEASCSDRVHWAYWIEHVLRVANAAPPAVVKDDTTFDFTRLVQPLEITFGKSFAAHIRNARLEAHHIVEDLEVHSVHIPYGKEKIALLNEAEVNKGVRITPDAFAQLVLQLAHDTLRDRLTAASQLCSVANFFHGLTALARTMTTELAQVIHILNEMERKALPKLGRK